LTRKDSPAITLRGHSHPLVRTAISSDSHWLATADTDIDSPKSREQTCRLWDLTTEDPGGSAVILPIQECQADRIGFSRNDRWLITAGNRTGVRLWHLGVRTLLDVAQRTAGRNLSDEERKGYLPIQSHTN
jgi:WD40 repeat protein